MDSEKQGIRLGHTVGVTEHKAVEIFREFTVKELEDVFDPYFANQEQMRKGLYSAQKEEQIRLFSHLRYQNPAVYALGKIIDSQFPAEGLRTSFKDRFSRIMDKSGEEADLAVANIFEVLFIFRGLMVGIAGAFTPQEDRESIFTYRYLSLNNLGLSLYQGEQIVRDVADLSKLTSAGDVVGAVGSVLLIDREEALEQAANDHGVILDELLLLRNTHPSFRDVHNYAVDKLYNGTLIGAMIDHPHKGETNIFRPEPNPLDLEWDGARYLPKQTQRGICPGSPLVLSSMMAMGRVLRRNRNMVVGVIQEHLAQSQ